MLWLAEAEVAVQQQLVLVVQQLVVAMLPNSSKYLLLDPASCGTGDSASEVSDELNGLEPLLRLSNLHVPSATCLESGCHISWLPNAAVLRLLHWQLAGAVLQLLHLHRGLQNTEVATAVAVALELLYLQCANILTLLLQSAGLRPTSHCSFFRLAHQPSYCHQ